MFARDFRRWLPLGVLIGLCALIGLIEPRFLSLDNLVRVSASAAMPLVVALGATFIILMGSIDLSIEGAMAFCGAVMVSCLTGPASFGLDLGVFAVVVAVGVAALFGALIGWIHVRMQIPSFMASLGMGFVGIGIATFMLGGERVPVDNALIRGLALSRLAGVPLSVYLAALMLALAWLIHSQTILGRHIMALGGGEDLARVSGVNIYRTRIMAFALAGAFFGVGATLACAKLGAASALLGAGQTFAAISAVVVGGTALTGGLGGPINTLVGVLIVMVISNGMIIVGLPTYVQQGVLGVAVIAAVLVNMSGRVPALVK